ncbi:MAG: 2-hydroxyacyl-CoA dehydratase [Stomatobaculum sp.]|nr:2-hydroxyacyl-CoA dehydratase [Stomatobaculum sp.]
MGEMNLTDRFRLGIDVGSTTTKIAALPEGSGRAVYIDYRRHHAEQRKSVIRALQEFARKYPEAEVSLVLTGSGAKLMADAADVPFIQEVVANSLALREYYGTVGTAIELGGQDAKILFFRKEEASGETVVDDMRMNGSCAGGTGAFIDEVASILKVPVEEFNACAEKGTTVYDISGRCGVFAKTDIQPLLNQGVSKNDLALSAFHAIAKQSIGGLAQGLDIRPPVAFEGGPLTFHPALIRVFAERLALQPEDIIVPDHPEMMIACGAALSLDSLFSDRCKWVTPGELVRLLENCPETVPEGEERLSRPFFENEAEREEFFREHPSEELQPAEYLPGQKVRAYLGIDCGSTTTKFVLMEEDGKLIDSYYGPNEGDPLKVLRQGLIAARDRCRSAGASLEIIAAGSTGYGELLTAKAFSTEYHMVETVAHMKAASKYAEQVSFILDIGGQDMKAIWVSKGIVTNIVVNEACSSGCGSFLENFARTLKIPVHEIAEEAFRSEAPAALGSRCTVFMNSSIITEQRNGRQPRDIMAGLCRSIIENVFTKVIRVSNIISLGDHIVVQGGTFKNDAVLRAMEQYLGKKVTRAPYPGLMGAIGAALLTKEQTEEALEKGTFRKTFIGLDALDRFFYTQEPNLVCPFCGNHCRRTVVRFPNGNTWVTNNRCERGEILGDPKDQSVRQQLAAAESKRKSVPDLFELRQKLLFQEYAIRKCAPERDTVIGLPRVLFNWEYMPFWTTFWRSLGFKVKISPESSRKLYESGLHAVTSDTVCFPAKLVHGHLRALRDMKVDRIFMPSVTAVQSENRAATSESMCAVVKGYPIVIRNSDNPAGKWGIPFDAPLFHWHKREDMHRQLKEYMKQEFGISEKTCEEAILQAERAMESFRMRLVREGKKALDQAAENGGYAVVLASRPYQNDALVNHGLSRMFTSMGIPVLTADSLPGVNDVDLSRSRLDIVNNFHARMLGAAVLAAEDPRLEYVQAVSFGCGHDAYLTDEIIRLMDSISGKIPLVLKLDESDVQGPLRIRVRSFIETVRMRRKQNTAPEVRELEDPYPVKFRKKDTEEKVVLVPNTSHAFCEILSAAFRTQNIKAVPLPVGHEEAARNGKKYVHNDICFPAQIVIGEIISALKSGKYEIGKVGVMMAKYIGDCRLTHYSALLRKALDDAGFREVPVLTNDPEDSRNMHPGYRMNLRTQARLVFSLPMIDVLEELLRKTRPYELEKGSAERCFERAKKEVVKGTEISIRAAREGFRKAIRIMNGIRCDFSKKKPRVLIVGEYLLNFHPGANHEIEHYLEKNGFEVIEARMTDVIRKTYFYQNAQIKEYHIRKNLREKSILKIQDHLFDLAQDMTDAIAKMSPLYKPAARLQDIVKDSDPIIHHTFDAGEGVLIPGEILHHAKEGCRNFIILQPFGCLPNHVVGRGIAKKLKELYPDAHILPLDYDPDVSTANIENRLQMLIMNGKMALQG